MDESQEYKQFETSDGFIICVPKSKFNNTELAHLIEDNKKSFSKNDSIIPLNFASHCVTSLFREGDPDDLINLHLIDCVLFFNPSFINDLSIEVYGVFFWKKDTGIKFPTDYIRKGWPGSKELSIKVSSRSHSVVINQKTIFPFLEFIEKNWHYIDFPMDECKFILVMLEFDFDDSEFQVWANRFFRKTPTSVKNIITLSRLIDSNWINNFNDTNLRLFTQFLLRSDNFEQELLKYYSVNQNLLKMILILHPHSVNQLWHFVHSEECRKIVSQNLDKFKTVKSPTIDCFCTFLEYLYPLCSQDQNSDKMMAQLAEIVVLYFSQRYPKSDDIVHKFINEKNDEKFKQMLIRLTALKISVSRQPCERDSLVAHLNRICRGW